jgi:hypothetical protein
MLRTIRTALAFAAALSLFGPTGGIAQNGYPNFGFHSYINSAPSYYAAPTNYGGNSFNTGLSGLNQPTAYNGMTYNTSSSTQAAEQLAQKVKGIWSQTMGRLQSSMPSQYPQQGQASNGMLPPMSKQEMLRVFLEGGEPQSGGMSAPAPSGASSEATSRAYNNYQTAQNEATKARNYSDRVRNYDTTTWSRKDDASRAEYAANNANYAAQRAESAAYNGDSQARNYAGMARDAANRARADANRARYNADTMH